MTRDELIEIALETFFCSLEDYSWPHATDDPKHRLRHQVSAAVNAVVEEMARVAQGDEPSATEYYRGRVHAAAAIRAYSRKDEG